MEEKQILIDELNINYKINGDKSAKSRRVLILHGWGGSSDSWVDVQSELAKAGYYVLCPDLPGFGKSDTPKKAWSVTRYVNFVLDFTDTLNFKKFYIIGHSFGGRITIKMASEHQNRLKKIVLCDPAGIKMKLDFKTEIIRLLAEIGNSIFDLRYLRVFKDAVRSIFYFFLRRKDYVKAEHIMRETMKIVLEEDLSLYLPKITNRTLIIWGEIDKIVPLKIAYIFKNKISSSELKILPKIGHSPNLEIPKELSKIIIKFLES